MTLFTRKRVFLYVNPLTPNDDYSGRTAPLTSKRCILYMYSTNIGTEYFKQGIYSPFFPLQNAVCFINITYLVPVLFTLIKFKKIIPAPKGSSSLTDDKFPTQDTYKTSDTRKSYLNIRALPTSL